MYSRVKRKIWSKVVICDAVTIILTLFTIVFGIAKTEAENIGMKGVCITVGIAAVFMLFAVVVTLSHILAWKSMHAALGSPSADEMDSMLSQAQPADSRDVPLVYITDSHILNFTMLQAYAIRDIRSVSKKSHSAGSANEAVTDYYDVVIDFDGKQRKDTISFLRSEERDAAYDKITAACGRSG